MSTWKSTHGPSTYLHAGAGKGWPHDHKAEDTFDIPITRIEPTRGPVFTPTHEWSEDTFDIPPRTTVLPTHEMTTLQPKPPTEEREYRAEYGERGEAFLVLDHTTTIAKFDTYADAQLAAEALNNHKGY